MKKLINDPFAVVDEMLDGYVRAHGAHLKRVANGRGIVRADAPVLGKVSVLIGGGSGHEPAFLGYVGPGVADGAAVGNVFASPSAETVLATTRALDGGMGVLYCYGNYAGDTLNFDMAAEMANLEGITVRTVLVTDDVASAPRGGEADRRGIAGDLFVFKVAGARASEGTTLAEVEAAARKANAQTRSMGVALSPCTVPAAGRPTFSLGEDEMEIGLGIHGEPGRHRWPLQTADAVAESLTRQLLEDLPYRRADRVAVLVNGLGATPFMELYILFRKVAAILDAEGIAIHRCWVGEYVTSLEMAGASVSLMRLDDELQRLVDAPAALPFFAQMA